MMRHSPSALLFGLCLFLYGCGGGTSTLQRGLDAWESNDYTTARNAFAKAIQAEPDHPRAAELHNLLGASEWKLGHTDDAMSSFRTARRLDPGSWAANYNLGVGHCLRGEVIQGATFLNEAALIRPEDFAPLAFLGAEALRAGRFREAEDAYRRAIERQPNDPSLRTGHAVAMAGLGYADRAKEALGVIHREQPQYTPAAWHLGQLYAGSDNATARRLYEDVLVREDDPDKSAAVRAALEALSSSAESTDDASGTTSVPPPPPTRDQYTDFLARAESARTAGQDRMVLNMCLMAARVAARDGESERETRAYESASQWAPKQPRAHYALARNHRENGRAEAALQSLERAVALSPTWGLAQLSRAEVATELGRADIARAAWSVVVEADPENADAWWGWIEMELKIGESDHRLKLLESFVSRFPEDARVTQARALIKQLTPVTSSTRSPAPRARPVSGTLTSAIDWFNKGSQAQESGAFQQAITAYNQAVEADPTYGAPYYNLGLVHQQVGNMEEARDAYLHAARLTSGNTRNKARHNLSLVYRQLGQAEKEIAVLRELVADSPEYATGHFLLANRLARESATSSEAGHHYEAFIRQAGNDPRSEEARAWLAAHRGR